MPTDVWFYVTEREQWPLDTRTHPITFSRKCGSQRFSRGGLVISTILLGLNGSVANNSRVKGSLKTIVQKASSEGEEKESLLLG